MLVFIYLDATMTGNNMEELVPFLSGYGATLNLNQIQKVFAVLFFLSFLFYLENKEIKIRFLDILATYSFGIFFVH